MNSNQVKYLMQLFDTSWEEVIDRHDKLRKKLAAEGYIFYNDFEGNEQWISGEDFKLIENTNIKATFTIDSDKNQNKGLFL